MRPNQPTVRILSAVLLTIAFLRWSGGLAYAGSATNISGLYYTGVDNHFSPLTGGAIDPHWSVTYAYASGTADNATYQGSGYVVNPIDSGWVSNTSPGQWITAPGASTAATGGTTNTGGDYLPGNGTTGNNKGIYVYTLAFTISGTGSGAVTNNVSIALTLAADDQYSIYVNPTLNANGSINTGSSTLGATRTSAWTATSPVYLQNFTDGNGNKNANFTIGTNYLVIEVDNTNSLTNTQTSTALNPSGLVVYQVGQALTIDGHVVPEVGTWLPIAGVLGLFGWSFWRRRTEAGSVV